MYKIIFHIQTTMLLMLCMYVLFVISASTSLANTNESFLVRYLEVRLMQLENIFNSNEDLSQNSFNVTKSINDMHEMDRNSIKRSPSSRNLHHKNIRDLLHVFPIRGKFMLIILLIMLIILFIVLIILLIMLIILMNILNII